MTFVIAHITDTHLSPAKPMFHENFALIADAIRRDAPDLVINTGDISLNGADLREDLEGALAMHEALGLPWAAVPGNHDIGDNQEIARKQPINAERRARFVDVFGPDFWMRDVPGWRLLGLNSLLMGSDLDAAAEQEAFIAEAVAGLGDRHLAIFLHKPLFQDSADETEISGTFVNPAPRDRLRAALGDARPKLVCSGHLHEYREQEKDGARLVWGPAPSFTISDWFLPTHGGVHIVGYVRVALSPDGGVETRLIQPEGLVPHDLADFPQAYGDLRAIKAEMEAAKAKAAAE